MKYRIWIAGAAVLLALGSVSAAVVLTRSAPAAAAIGTAVTASSATPIPAAEDTAVYLVREYSGELCVCQEGKLLERTGIPVSTLPQSDRELAEVGITVVGQAALSELLGDLGS